jgi:hypothetical protein
MAWAYAVVGIVSTVLSAAQQAKQGKMQEEIAGRQASAREREGIARYAEGTRIAQEEIRQGRIMQSQARAAMASSGGVTTDPGAVVQLGNIGAEAEYNALAALYSGKSAKTAADEDAAMMRYGGSMARRQARASALSTVLQGATSAYSSYKDWKRSKMTTGSSWLNPNTGSRYAY